MQASGGGGGLSSATTSPFHTRGSGGGAGGGGANGGGADGGADGSRKATWFGFGVESESDSDAAWSDEMEMEACEKKRKTIVANQSIDAMHGCTLSLKASVVSCIMRLFKLNRNQNHILQATQHTRPYTRCDIR